MSALFGLAEVEAALPVVRAVMPPTPQFIDVIDAVELDHPDRASHPHVAHARHVATGCEALP